MRNKKRKVIIKHAENPCTPDLGRSGRRAAWIMIRWLKANRIIRSTHVLEECLVCGGQRSRDRAPPACHTDTGRRYGFVPNIGRRRKRAGSDRKSGVSGKRVSVRVVLGGRRIFENKGSVKKKKKK